MMMARVRAVGLLAALMMPLGIAVHVIWEIAGIGVQADFSQRHGYLVVLFLAAVALLIGLARGAETVHDRRRALALLVASLPFRGRGTGFAIVLVSLQLLFAATTLGIEGTPLTMLGSLATLTCAFVAALLGSWLLGLFAAPLIAFACALSVHMHVDRAIRCAVRLLRRSSARNFAPRTRVYTLFVPNRPPPRFAPISA